MSERKARSSGWYYAVATLLPVLGWLELKLRKNVLNGSLIAFSQWEMYTGPLAHWVELRKK